MGVYDSTGNTTGQGRLVTSKRRIKLKGKTVAAPKKGVNPFAKAMPKKSAGTKAAKAVGKRTKGPAGSLAKKAVAKKSVKGGTKNQTGKLVIKTPTTKQGQRKGK